MVTKHVSAAEAKAHLASLVSEVEHGGKDVIIERHGRPVAALVSMEDFARLKVKRPPVGGNGALALVGIWSELTNDEIDAIVDNIYENRRTAIDRPVAPLE